MKKALLAFGLLCISLMVQSCTSDTDDIAPVRETLSTSSPTDSITPYSTTYTTQDNGDLTKDPEKKK